MNMLNNLHEMSVFQGSLLEGRIPTKQIGLWKTSENHMVCATAEIQVVHKLHTTYRC